MQLIPYIMFDGNAQEALDFYQEVFKAKAPEIMHYSDGPDMKTPADYSEKILHAELEFGSNILYISDNFPGAVSAISDKVSFNLGLDSEEELNETFEALSKGATNIEVPEVQFWGAMFGSLDDQFGIHWSFNYQLPAVE